MATGSGLLALAMLAAGGPSPSDVDANGFRVKLRVLTMDGLEWRSASYARLQAVGRQGTSAIWTADRALASALADRARSKIDCPIVTGKGNATLCRSDVIAYVAAVDRVADGPINQSTSLAFLPRPDRIEAGFALNVAARRIDQGFLTRLTLDERCVDALHEVPQTEAVRPSTAKAPRTPAEVGREIINVVMCGDQADAGRSISCKVQVPEVSICRIDGEWLIPTDGVLLVSLGVKTVADDKGMAVVRERLAVIEVDGADATPGRPEARADAAPPMPFQYARLPMPAAPARSMPEPLDPDGNLVDLPPLPEAVASADLERIKPAPNQPSPQTQIFPSPSFDPERDTELARTSFDAENPAAKRPPSAHGSEAQARIRLLERAIDALEKAAQGADLDTFEVDFKELKAAATGCEKCDADERECPLASASSMPPGGLKLASETTAQLGVTVKKADGSNSLEISGSLNEALKAPGRTETTVIPLGGKLALEIRATVVPSPADKGPTDRKESDWCGTAEALGKMPQMRKPESQAKQGDPSASPR